MAKRHGGAALRMDLRMEAGRLASAPIARAPIGEGVNRQRKPCESVGARANRPARRSASRLAQLRKGCGATVAAKLLCF
jgi:hypothetical protein